MVAGPCATLQTTFPSYAAVATYIHGHTVVLRGLDELRELPVRHGIGRAALLYSHDDLLSIVRIDLCLFGIGLSLCRGPDCRGASHEEGRQSFARAPCVTVSARVSRLDPPSLLLRDNEGRRPCREDGYGNSCVWLHGEVVVPAFCGVCYRVFFLASRLRVRGTPRRHGRLITRVKRDELARSKISTRVFSLGCARGAGGHLHPALKNAERPGAEKPSTQLCKDSSFVSFARLHERNQTV